MSRAEHYLHLFFIRPYQGFSAGAVVPPGAASRVFYEVALPWCCKIQV